MILDIFFIYNICDLNVGYPENKEDNLINKIFERVAKMINIKNSALRYNRYEYNNIKI